MSRNKTNCLKDLNAALHSAFEDNDNVILIGEDLFDPYGGAFKVTAGLSTKFPDRVHSSPISEAAITGIGIGSAMRGQKVIVEIMFGDFITLAFDQIVNHAAKFPYIYGKYFISIIKSPCHFTRSRTITKTKRKNFFPWCWGRSG